MLIGRPTCCDASNCDDVLHHIAIYEYYNIAALFLMCKLLRTVACMAVHKVALVMNMMCPTSLNIFVITIVTLERLSGLGNCWQAYRFGDIQISCSLVFYPCHVGACITEFTVLPPSSRTDESLCYSVRTCWRPMLMGLVSRFTNKDYIKLIVLLMKTKFV